MSKKFSCFDLSSSEVKLIMKVTPKNTVNLLWILVTGRKIRKEPNKQDEKLFSTNNNKSKILPNS